MATEAELQNTFKAVLCGIPRAADLYQVRNATTKKLRKNTKRCELSRKNNHVEMAVWRIDGPRLFYTGWSVVLKLNLEMGGIDATLESPHDAKNQYDQAGVDGQFCPFAKPSQIKSSVSHLTAYLIDYIESAYMLHKVHARTLVQA